MTLQLSHLQMFNTIYDYERFLSSSKECGKGIVDSNGNLAALAQLSKERPDKWLFTITWVSDGRYLGDYISPFMPSEENLATFDHACHWLAAMLQKYVETDSPNAIATPIPAFSYLTHPEALDSRWITLEEEDGLSKQFDVSTIFPANGKLIIWSRFFHPTEPGFDEVAKRPFIGMLFCNEYNLTNHTQCTRRAIGIYDNGSYGEHGHVAPQWNPISSFGKAILDNLRQTMAHA